MNLLCKEHLPPKYDPDIHKFGTAWVRRFCKRWQISLRKKNNSKCKSVFERLHQVKNYDKWSYIIGKTLQTGMIPTLTMTSSQARTLEVQVKIAPKAIQLMKNLRYPRKLNRHRKRDI